MPRWNDLRLERWQRMRDRAHAGAGVQAQLGETTSLNIGYRGVTGDYRGEFAGSDERRNFGATFHMRW